MPRFYPFQKVFRHFKTMSFLALMISVSLHTYAQGKFDQQLSQPLVTLIALSSLAIIPIVLVMMTSFIKISVVLALVRNALGTQQIPPNQVITGLSLILTIYIMAPIGIEIYNNAQSVIEQKSSEGFLSNATVALAQEAAGKSKEPVRNFLLKHTNPNERKIFFELAKSLRKPEDRESIRNDDFLIITPAFVVSELAEAFKIGFIIFLPFLVVDMVVANVLLSLGMFQLSPVTVSLPFKLLLFVLVDGWTLLARSLITTYLTKTS